MASFTDLLSVDLILLHLSPYLPVSSLLRLAATSKSIRSVIHQTPGAFRHLDLSPCRTGSTQIAPIDRGGFSWRAERIDENLTEDDFYSGPLRGIFSKLRKYDVLRDVQTLILDRQAVTSDVVYDIVCGHEFRVKLLSLIEVQAMNMGKLRQTLSHACRASRPEGTPKLQALYLFSDADTPSVQREVPSGAEGHEGGVTVSTGAQLGAQINSRSRAELFGRDPHPCYRAAGSRPVLHRALGWEDTLNKCRDIIAFDAVLCRGPRHDPLNGNARPSIGSVYLGGQGCEQCGKMPEGFVVAGKAPISSVPLLRPPPIHSSSARAAQLIPQSSGTSDDVPVVARCRDCVSERWCEACNRFWCEDCYRPVTNGTIPIPSPNDPNEPVAAVNSHIKVFMGFCVERCLRTPKSLRTRRAAAMFFPHTLDRVSL